MRVFTIVPLSQSTKLDGNGFTGSDGWLPGDYGALESVYTLGSNWSPDGESPERIDFDREKDCSWGRKRTEHCKVMTRIRIALLSDKESHLDVDFQKLSVVFHT